MIKAYRFKLEPNHKQKYALARTLDVCRELYNDCLYQRKLHRTNRFDQSAELTELKAAFPVYKNVYSQVLQQVLDRLDKSFKNYFRSGFGFPRFKGQHRFDSFTYPQSGFSLDGKQLSLSKIGNVKVRLSRELPADAVVKTCTLKRTVSGWFATLVFEYTPRPLPASDLAVGIDVGVRKKGSHRRRKAVVQFQKIHARIVSQRADFLHKHSTAVVRKYGTIVVEALNVAGMSRSTLAKQILDCSWSEFFRMLKYKAADAGRRVEEIDPRYTSQECSECGFVSKDNRKTQADFACTSCGHTDNADHNGAVNILARNEPLDANPSGVTLCVV